MKQSTNYDILIIGGGLAGLTTALHLANNGIKICLVEKYNYPHHKVCGEYVSNEVLPYLNSLGINPFVKGAKKISKLELTDKKGKAVFANLPLGGFGISRYAFDNLLYEAVKNKIEIVFDTVEKVIFESNSFKVFTQEKTVYSADFVIGAYGKRSNIDISLNREFIIKPSAWLAVKAHYNIDFPEDTVALHNFDGGYCGLSKVESGAVNACYLATLKEFKKYGDVQTFQAEVLSKNPNLKTFLNEAKPVFSKPLTISQISFQTKLPVENHIFMIGDSAGLIHPLCGNGMAMAIQGAKIFSELFLKAFNDNSINREVLEQEYAIEWRKAFLGRLKAGKYIQRLLMHPTTAKLAFSAAKAMPSILPLLIKQTHGNY